MYIPNISLILATICLVSAADSEKRVPQGFQGMRGKKSVSEEVFPDNIVDEPKRNIEEKDFRERRPESQYVAYPCPDKRAQFFGTRGKKQLDYEYEKRAPSGFLGMRGKKDYPEDAYDPAYYEKRAPSGFMGMRGKKDYESIIDEVKRAPSAGFFGMRGKKMPARSGFFGMRGKKYPYEFRGKFVGVRGKKMSNDVAIPEYYNNMDLGKTVEGLDINQLMLLLTENDAGYNNPEQETALTEQDYPLN